MTIYSRPIHNVPVSFCNVQKERLYLYRYGDECIDVTGGWDVTYQANCSASKQSDHLFWQVSSGTMQQAFYHTVNKIDFSVWDTFHIDFEDYITNGNTSEFMFWASSSRTTRCYNESGKFCDILRTNNGSKGNYYKNKRNLDFSVTNYMEFDANLSNGNTWLQGNQLYTIANPYYLAVGHYSDYSQTGYGKVYAIWLERIVVPTAQNSQE